jgi:uncharacterized membrane protein
MVLTRYIADMLYEERTECILPSLEGVLCIILPVGGLLFGIFLCFAGLPLFLSILEFFFFTELLVVWMQMDYLSALKDYKGILLGYVIAILVEALTAVVLSLLFETSLSILLISVLCGYGVMMLFHFNLLYRYFINSKTESFQFLNWFDEYRDLSIIGFCVNFGLFSHLVIGWFSVIGEKIHGLFYGAPQYDIPALMAFLTILITTINFVASVEVHFYPKYRKYYDLFNGKGSILEIKRAEEEMLTVLDHEITYAARRQFYGTALMLSLGLLILNKLPLGFNSLMNGYFRILCIGYGIYAIGNVMMLILLYFSNYKGARNAAIGFAVSTTLLSLLSLLGDVKYYGFAFSMGSMVYYLLSFSELQSFTRRLHYHILSRQPMIYVQKTGLGRALNVRLTELEDQFKNKIFSMPKKGSMK